MYISLVWSSMPDWDAMESVAGHFATCRVPLRDLLITHSAELHDLRLSTVAPTCTEFQLPGLHSH